MRAAHLRTSLRPRSALVLLCTLLLAAAAIVAVGRLQADATAARDSQLELVALRLDLAQIQQVPWGASPDEGDDPDVVREELVGAEEAIDDAINRLSRERGLPERGRIVTPFKLTMGALWEVFSLVSKGRGDEAGEASSLAAHQAAVADAALLKASERYRERSLAALEQSRRGADAVIALLFLSFAWFYRRATKARHTAEALAADNRRLLAASRAEAITDALTGLGNRRALTAELERLRPAEDEQVLLALYDLDGFKRYNDTLGHLAGDALLTRIGGRLAKTMDGVGSAYRIGGDEFCVVAQVRAGAAAPVAELAASALSDDAGGYAIGCSYGIALMPHDAARGEDALRIADERMYERKRARAEAAFEAVVGERARRVAR